MLIPRLATAGVKLSRCRIFGQRRVSIPADVHWLTSVLRTHQCDMLWIDPLDSLMSEESRRDGYAVRVGLEALSHMAADLGIPVLGVRHPGKDPKNVCRGFTEWRDVPRQILEVMHDEGPPERRFVRRWKDPCGWGRSPRQFTLDGEPGSPLVFRLGDESTDDDVDSLSHMDRLERSMIDEAESLLKEILKEDWQPSAIVRSAAQAEGITDTILRRAARRIGYKKARGGQGKAHVCYWALADCGTPAPCHTPPLLPQSNPVQGGGA